MTEEEILRFIEPYDENLKDLVNGLLIERNQLIDSGMTFASGIEKAIDQMQKIVDRMPGRPNITLLSDGDGWYWLYVNKKLAKEGHNCADLQILCEVLEFPFEYRDVTVGYDAPEELP